MKWLITACLTLWILWWYVIKGREINQMFIQFTPALSNALTGRNADGSFPYPKDTLETAKEAYIRTGDLARFEQQIGQILRVEVLA